MRRFAITAMRVLAGLTLVLAGGMASAQPEKPLLALGQLEPGLWDVRSLDNRPQRTKPICLGDPTVLIQLEHRSITCQQLVIANTLQSLTVHYVCPFNGFGQTSVRVQTPRFARIDTQGIVNNAPFGYRADIRRLGPCAVQGNHPR